MKILLVCNLGMSSGLMGEKLKKAAKELGVDAEVNAVPMGEIEEDSVKGIDCVLISPQVRFMKKDVEKMVEEKTVVLVMDTVEFGLMQADKIMAKVLEAVK